MKTCRVILEATIAHGPQRIVPGQIIELPDAVAATLVASNVVAYWPAPAAVSVPEPEPVLPNEPAPVFRQPKKVTKSKGPK